MNIVSKIHIQCNHTVSYSVMKRPRKKNQNQKYHVFERVKGLITVVQKRTKLTIGQKHSSP